MMDWDGCAKNKLRYAQAQSDLAAARVRGMKIAAELDPPTAAKGTFPFPARTCAEWQFRDNSPNRRTPIKAEDNRRKISRAAA